ncbi:MAG: CheR family methyltransferase [Bacillota bacterium]
MTLKFDKFREKVSRNINIDLSSYKEKRVKRRINSLMDRHDITDYDECLKLLKSDANFKEQFLDHFTINTSEFYRNPKNFKYLKEDIFPRLFDQNHKVKIWSAACSIGAEAYTLAIMLKEAGFSSNRYEIVATDIDRNILKQARRGVYNKNSIKKVNDRILNKYFTVRDDEYHISSQIKSQVQFKHHNLLNDPYQSNWNLILCRNVFIYFTREIKDKITEKLSQALAKDGFLFLGNTEYLLQPNKFNLEKEHTSFYQRID